MSDAKDLVGDRQFIDIRELHRAKLLEQSPGKGKEFTLHWEDGEWVRFVRVEVNPEQVVLSYQDRLPGEDRSQLQLLQLWRTASTLVHLSYAGLPSARCGLVPQRGLGFRMPQLRFVYLSMQATESAKPGSTP